MKQFNFSDLTGHTTDVLSVAMHEPVSLAQRGKVRIVMLPVEQYDRLAAFDEGHTASWVSDAPKEDLDDLVAGFEELARGAER